MNYDNYPDIIENKPEKIESILIAVLSGNGVSHKPAQLYIFIVNFSEYI